MKDKELKNLVAQAYEEGEGIFRLAPTWVPRAFLVPGRRMKLAPQDIYILGVKRGGIDERWLSSVTRADNPGAPKDEGLSYIVFNDKKIALSKLSTTSHISSTNRLLAFFIQSDFSLIDLLLKFSNSAAILNHLFLV